eukprot:jgi/Mesen1/9710/ME000069S09107
MEAQEIPPGLGPPPSDLTGVCFRDQIFLNFVGGSLVVANVFDYFSNSPFYDRTCNNEQLRVQSIWPLDQAQLTRMTGVEYMLSTVQEPHLFVFVKQRREGPNKVTPAGAYYVLDGSIYQAPNLQSVLWSRIARALDHIGRAFAETRDKMTRAGADAGEKGGEVEEKAPAGKQISMAELMRVDQVLGAVFRKLPPAPPPPLPAGQQQLPPEEQQQEGEGEGEEDKEVPSSAGGDLAPVSGQPEPKPADQERMLGTRRQVASEGPPAKRAKA